MRKIFRTGLTSACAAVISIGGPAVAQTINQPYVVAPGQTYTESNAVGNPATGLTAVTVSGGGTLYLSNAGNIFSGGTFATGNSTVQIDSDAELGNTIGGVVLGDAVSAGKLSFINTAALASARPIILNAGGGWFIVNSLGTSLSGTISGPGGLTVSGAGGVLNLLAANTYTGTTLVTGASTLGIAADSSLGGYTIATTTSNITGTTTTTTLTTANQLILDGGTLLFNGGIGIAHPISLTANGGAFDTNGFNSSISTPVTGPGGLNKVGAGFLILDGVNTYSGGTVVNAGVLQVGDAANPIASITGPVSIAQGASFAGTGTVLGTISNPAGTVASGAGGAAGLTATNYVQGSAGTLTIPIVSAGAATFRVTNSASLAGTLNLSYGTGFFKPGTYTLITAPTMTGAFSSVTGTVPSAGLRQTIITTPQAVEVMLTQLTTLPDRATIYPSMISVAVDEAQAATGTVLARLRDARAMAIADGINAALSSNHRVRGTSPYGAWIQPTGNMSSLSGSGAPHVSANGGGFLGGIDWSVAEGMAMGVALGYSRSGIDETGGSHSTLSVPRLFVYGDWWKGPFAIDAAVSAGSPSFDTTRPVIISPQTAKSSHDGKEFSAAMQGSLNFLFGKWSVSPAAGAKYLSLSENHFSESGTDIYNFSVGGIHANSLRPFIDTTVIRRFDLGGKTAVVPQLTVGYEDELLKTTRAISAETQGDAANWVFSGAKPSRGAVDMKADVSIETDKQTSYYVEYGRVQGSNSSADSFAAGFRYRL